MSVINKVLRDLDNRAADGGRPVADRPTGSADAQIPPGVVAVAPLAPHGPVPPARRVWPTAALLMGVLGTGVALWWWQAGAGADLASGGDAAMPVRASVPGVPAVPVTQVTAAPVPVPAPADVPAAAASEALFPAGMARPEVLAPLPTPVPVPPAPVPQGVAGPSAAPGVVAGNSPAPAVRQAPSGPATPASTAARMASVLPPAAPAQKAAAAEVPPVVIPPVVPWPEAALDAVGQGQRMWNSGARDTALAFLRDALAGVERAHGAELTAVGEGATAALAMVRELVRMEQVLGNHAQVLAVLKRHEALWARQPELWAVRGSAAQRLSQHAEAADAYRTALRLRPGEPRWMLGAAVSLAAVGRQAEAAQLAEQARRSGPVNPDVLSYLRQLGVPLASDNPGN